MGTRVSYPLEGKSTKEIMEKLSIKNKTRIQQKLGYKSPIEYRQSVTQ